MQAVSHVGGSTNTNWHASFGQVPATSTLPERRAILPSRTRRNEGSLPMTTRLTPVPGSGPNQPPPRHIVCADGDADYFALLGAPLHERVADAGFVLDWHHGEPVDDAAWLARIGDAEGVLLFWALPDAVLRALPYAKVIAWVGTGVGEFVNLDLATERGIAVCNTPGYGNTAVAEHALGLLLALARNTAAHDRALRAGRWPRDEVRGMELADKTIGIVGLGGIGGQFATLCAALGMRVLVWTRSPDPARLAALGATAVPDLDDLLRASDAVSLHLPVTPETANILDARRLALLPEHALLVNTARGELVDEDALAAALRAGRLAGAALDVFRDEPLPPNHRWRDIENVILTPHVGFRTPEASGRSVRLALENLLAYLGDGTPQHVVNAGALGSRSR